MRSCSGTDTEATYSLLPFRKAYLRWLTWPFLFLNTLIHYELYHLHFFNSLLRNGVQKCPIRLTYLLCFREKSLFWALYACDSKTRSVAPFLITIQSKYQVFFTYSVVTVYQDFKSPVLNERVKVAHKTEFYSYESLYEPILTKAETN